MDTAVALKLHDDLLAAQPEGARHDSDICPLCVEKASQATASDPSRFGGPDVSKSSTQSTEGGDNPTMSDISQEAHNALLKQAVADAVAEATKATESALATKTGEAADAAKRIEELVVVKAPEGEQRVVRFGAWVRLEDENGGEVEYQIVGPDEFDLAHGKISIDAPVARALIGKQEGDEVLVRRPKGEIVYTVTAIRYR